MSSKKLYVGNLNFKTTDEDLRNLFSQFGEVISARVITDRDTGRSKGFGFVEMDDSSAETAIQNLNGSAFLGRDVTVNEARPQAERPMGGGYGQRNGGGFEQRNRGFNAR